MPRAGQLARSPGRSRAAPDQRIVPPSMAMAASDQPIGGPALQHRGGAQIGEQQGRGHGLSLIISAFNLNMYALILSTESRHANSNGRPGPYADRLAAGRGNPHRR